jgi:hypothetical protein
MDAALVEANKARRLQFEEKFKVSEAHLAPSTKVKSLFIWIY